MNAGIDTDSLRQEFLAESRELLQRAEEVVLRLERGADPAVLNELFRLVHTAKGNVGIFGKKRLTGVAHELETLLNHVRKGRLEPDGNVIDIVLVGLDWLQQALSDPDGDLAHEPDLEERIRAYTPAEAQVVVSPLAAPAAPAQTRPTAAAEAPASAARPTQRTKVPGSLVREAERLGQEIAVGFLDLSDQADGSLEEFGLRCEKARQDGLLVLCRLRPDDLPFLHEQNGGTLPASLILAGQAPVAEAFARYGFRATRIKVLTARVTQAAAQAVTRPAPLQQASPGRAVESLSAGPPVTQADEPDLSLGAAPPEFGTAVTGTASSDGTTQIEHLRVPLPLIDRLIRLAGATVGARNELTQHIQGYDDPRLHLVGNRLSQMVTQLQEEIMRTRLQELRALFGRIPRAVRDVCRLTGKEAAVSFDGEDVELDKNLIDVIGEAILHIVRNAIDHGIESPDERLRRGKPPTGNLRIVAGMQGGSVTLSIRDDGAGLDYAALRASAVRNNLLSAAEAGALTDEDAAELIFAPGLSTAQRVTETSGRGVGMDAVRESFKRAGGSITVSSVPGKGTHFFASLPQTLSIVTCVTVSVQGDRYAIPQAGIDELVRFTHENTSTVGQQLVYRLRDRLLALVDLGALLYDRPVDSSREAFLVVVQSERHRFGIIVQEIGNPEEILVKPIGIHFDGIPVYSGAAVLGDGSVTAILDAAGIARLAGLQADQEDLTAAATDRSQETAESHMLFEAAGQRYALSTMFRPRILRYTAESVERVLGRNVIKHEGQIVPIVFTGRTDGDGAAQFLILLRSGTSAFALGAETIIGVQEQIEMLQEDIFKEGDTSGQAIVDGRTVLILNVASISHRLEREGFRGTLIQERLGSIPEVRA